MADVGMKVASDKQLQGEAELQSGVRQTRLAGVLSQNFKQR